MNFSAYQWAAIAIGDLVLRAGYFLFSSFNILLTPISVALTTLHLIVLVFFSGLMRAAMRPSGIANSITLLLTNSVFVLVFVSVWINSIWSGRQTVCLGAFQEKCPWIEGTITEIGSQAIGREVLFQLIINVVPIFTVLAYRSRSTSRR